MPSPGFQPFGGGLVRSGWAREVVTPAYDGMTVEERADVLRRHPHSYLGAIVDRDDVVDGSHLAAGRAAVQRLLAAGAFEVRSPSFYVCRLTEGGHRQTGVVGEVPLRWADDGRLLGHEQTRVDRVAELARHLEVVGVASSPVALAHRPDRELARSVQEVAAGPPLRSFQLDDGLSIELWAVDDPATAEQIRRRVEAGRLYITDGHHRVEAARRLRLGREDEPGRHQHVLGVLFGEDELAVQPFHRVVVPRPASIREALAAVGEIRPVDGPPVPDRQGSFGVTWDGRWFRLAVDAGPDELAPDVLQRAVLGPVFGIGDPTRDPRVAAIAGTVPPEVVAGRADEAGGVAFLLHAVSVGQLMVTADQGRTLPPKSTYFVPKVRSGIYLRPVSDGDGPW